MIGSIEHLIEQFDGQYFSDQDLKSIEYYHQEYQLRLEIYNLLSKESKSIQAEVLSLMKPHYAKLSERKQKRCERDVELVLRYVALSVLSDNETMLYDKLLIWLQNILRALKVSELSVLEYSNLKKVIEKRFKADQARCINRYVDLCIQALSVVT